MLRIQTSTYPNEFACRDVVDFDLGVDTANADVWCTGDRILCPGAAASRRLFLFQQGVISIQAATD